MSPGQYAMQQQRALGSDPESDPITISMQLQQTTDPFQRQRLLQLLHAAMVRHNYPQEHINSAMASARQPVITGGALRMLRPHVTASPLCCAVLCALGGGTWCGISAIWTALLRPHWHHCSKCQH